MREKKFQRVRWIFFIAPALVALLVLAFMYRWPLRQKLAQLGKPALPPAQNPADFASATTQNSDKQTPDTSTPAAQNAQKAPAKKTPSPSLVDAMPASKKSTQSPRKITQEAVNLNVPFASQAPLGDWSLPYQEACEEAAAIMVNHYWSGKKLDPPTMDAEIQALVAFENKIFGDYKDTTAEQIARMLREYFGYRHVEVTYGITMDDVKREIAAGRPVLLPAAGRLLGNPNFREPGPLYHVVVAKGYTRGKIITNDPGTRLGKDFIYDPNVLMNAVHDWNPQDMLKGEKVMIVVKD